MRAFVFPPLRRAAQRGAIAIVALITLPILFGFGALVVDLARLFVYKTEIQNAMDSCALAATSPLTGVNDPNIFDVARAHGLATMDLSRNGVATRTAQTVNRLHFQKDNFVLADVAVEFSTALSGQPWIAATSASFAGITPATAKYVRCTYHDDGNTLFLKPLLSVFVGGVSSTANVSADAVAKLGHAQSTCAFPVALCIVPGSTATTSPPWGLVVGARKVSVNNPSSGYGTGNYGWLDFTPPAGGASELRSLITGNGSCSVVVGATVGQPGVVSTLESAWNSRYGVYKNPLNATTAPPDFTGYSYPTGSNNYANYVTRLASRASFAPPGGAPGSITVLTSAQHAALGQKRRVVTAAMVNCSVWNTSPSTNPPVLDFGCILLLAPVKDGGPPAQWLQTSNTLDIEYLGLATAVNTPCASSGLGGGTYGPLVPVLAK